MKIMLSVFVSLLCCINFFFANAQTKDQLTFTQQDAVKIDGYIGHKIDVCINNGIEKTNENYLVETFKHRIETFQWQSEFWGKYVISLTDAYNYTKNKKLLEKFHNAVAALIATQSADGYIGNYDLQYRLEEWDIWGIKYTMLGLLDYYEITNSSQALTSIKKLANYVIENVNKKNIPFYKFGNYKGMASSSILEPMVKLYNLTNDKKYLNFANYIVQSWNEKGASQLVTKALENTPVGKRFPIPAKWYGPDNGQKAYEMMSCYEGLLELYRITGNDRYLNAVEMAAENIRQTEIMITGSGASMECWFGGAATQSVPVKHTMEACVTVTWMKLCLQLLKITGDAKWANEIEKSYYNALLGTMQPNGSTWSKYIGIKGKKYLGENQCGMNLNCCIANGPRGIMLITKEAFMKSERGVAVNFYGQSQATMKLKNDLVVKFNLISDYPKTGGIFINIDPNKPKAFEVLLRIPEWAGTMKVFVNNTLVSTVERSGYAVIYRKWQKGDKIKLVIDMSLRMFALKSDAQHYSLLYGPLVLASDRRYQDAPFYEFYTPQIKDTKIPFQIIDKSKYENVFFEIKIPFIKEVDGLIDKTDTLTLVDFASAGNTWDETSSYQVWMQKTRDVSKEKN